MEGFINPFNFGSASFQPTMPQMDLAQIAAAHLAAGGIRPEQFLRDPSTLAAVAPQAASPQVPENVWDPTPVSGPGGPAVNSATGSPLSMAPEGEAQAAATTPEKGGDLAKRLTDSLRGLKMPPAPTAQTVRTPAPVNPPAPGAVQGGNILALLHALGSGAGGVKPGVVPMPLFGR